MSAPYLLSLSALHAAAPGVMDVVFGPDGDFEGAPRWGGPVRIDCGNQSPGYAFVVGPVTSEGLYLATASGGRHRMAHPDFWPSWSSRLSLPCDVPSVAARLAGLCARVRTALSLCVLSASLWALVRAVWPA